MTDLAIQEESIEQVLGRVSDAFFAVDTDWEFTYVNERAEEIIDETREELVGDPLWKHFDGIRDTEFYEQYRESMETQETRSFEAYYPPLSAWFRVHTYPSESGLSVYFEDVTEHRHRQEELARYETIVETVGDGVYAVDESGRFTFVNDAYAEMSGYDPDDLLGAKATTVVPESVHEEAVQIGKRLRTGDQARLSMEAEIERPDGETVVSEATFTLMSVDGKTERVAVVRDITEHKRRKRQLEEHRDMLADHVERTELVQRVNQAIVGATSQTEIRERVCEILTDSEYYQTAWIGDGEDGELRLQSGAGVPPEGLQALVDAAEAEGGIGPVARALRRGAIQVQQHIDGGSDDPRAEAFAEWGYHSSISLPLVHEGETAGVLTIDSERTRAFSGTERELLASLADTVAYALQTVTERRQFRTLVDASTEYAIFRLDTDGCVQTWNRGAERIKGYEKDEILGEHFSTFYTDADREAGVPAENLERALTQGAVEDEGWRVRADGSTFWANVTITAIRDEDGTLDGFAKVTRDMTERREYEQQLRRQNELTEQLLETSPVAILAFDADGTLVHANSQASDQLGFEIDVNDPSDAAGDYTVGDLVIYDEDGAPIPADDRPINRTLEHGERITDETIVLKADDGSKRWYSYRSAPVFDESGDVDLAVVTCDDISDIKRREAELSRLDHVNTVIRRLNSTLVESSDRETVRETVCTELAASEPYVAAWYCEVDLAADDLIPVASAGLDTDVDDATIPVGGTLSGRAVRSGEVSTGSLGDEHPFAPALPQSDHGGDATVAAVPITYSQAQHGVLCLAATDETAFTEDIRELFAELGETIGHGLTSIIRKEGLMGDGATRLNFRFRDFFAENYDLAAEFDSDGLAMEIDKTVAVGDGTILQYVSVPRDSADEAADLFAADAEVERFRRLDADDEDETVRFEIKQPQSPLITALTEYGGRLVSVEISDGDFHVIIEFPTSVSIREVVTRVTDVYPSADLEAQRSVESADRSSDSYRERILEDLTDRQRTALQTAQFAGYFDWPRTTTGEEVAESLDLSPSTFSQHLRAGERKTFSTLFGSDA